MIKKRLNKTLALLIVLSCILVQTTCSAEITTNTTPQIKNVIYMIPDGGGYANYDFSAAVKAAGGFDRTRFPNATPIDGQSMNLINYLRGSERTYSANSVITDSAAAGTALSSGYKTNNGNIGVDPYCIPHANILEACQAAGKKTGLVSTYEWSNATPAAFSSHSISRNNYSDISEQIVNQGIDCVLGVGFGLAQWGSIDEATARGYKVINDKTELAEVKPGDKIWGNMTGNGAFPFDIELTDTQPNLSEMTAAAIRSLSDSNNGFFLMVEGSKVDGGGHANNLVQVASEYIAFDAAFKTAVEFAKTRTDTAVIAMPDHDTGGLNLSSDYSADVAACQNGINSTYGVSWTTSGHTNRNCGVWMYLPDGVNPPDGLSQTPGDTESTRTDLVINNIQLAPYVESLFGNEVNMERTTKQLYQDVTAMGTYDSTTKTFSFTNYDIKVKPNQSTAKVNGKDVDLKGEVTLYINNRFYVPMLLLDNISSVPEYGLLDAQINLSYEITTVKANINLTSPYNMPPMTYQTIFAYYNSEGVLIDVHLNGAEQAIENGTKTFELSDTMPQNTKTIKCLMWSDLTEVLPISISTIQIS